MVSLCSCCSTPLPTPLSHQHTPQYPLLKKLHEYNVCYGHREKNTKPVCDGNQLLTKRFQFFDVSHKDIQNACYMCHYCVNTILHLGQWNTTQPTLWMLPPSPQLQFEYEVIGYYVLVRFFSFESFLIQHIYFNMKRGANEITATSQFLWKLQVCITLL